MGQAKIRGPLSVRIQESQARIAEAKKLHEEKEAEKRHKAHLAEQQRRRDLVARFGNDRAQQILDREKHKRRESQELVAMMFGMAAGMNMPRRRNTEFDEMEAFYKSKS